MKEGCCVGCRAERGTVLTAHVERRTDEEGGSYLQMVSSAIHSVGGW